MLGYINLGWNKFDIYFNFEEISIFWLINIYIKNDFYQDLMTWNLCQIFTYMAKLYLFTQAVSCEKDLCNRLLVPKTWTLIPISPCFVTTNFFDFSTLVALSPYGSILHKNGPQQSTQSVKNINFDTHLAMLCDN